MLFYWISELESLSQLRIINQTWQHLPLMLRSTELNTLGMTNAILNGPLYHASAAISRLKD